MKPPAFNSVKATKSTSSQVSSDETGPSAWARIDKSLMNFCSAVSVRLPFDEDKPVWSGICIGLLVLSLMHSCAPKTHAPRSNRYQAKPPSGLAEPGSLYCGARRGQETRETPHGISAQSRNHLRQQRFRVSWFLLFNPNNFRHKPSVQPGSYHPQRRTQHRKSRPR